MGGGARRGRPDHAARGAKTASLAPLWKVALFAFAVTWLAALVRWWPLTQFPVWGSDAGEHAALLETSIALGGRLPSDYAGWGGAYPDFPGMYILSGTFAQLSGVDPFVAMSVVVPAAASLSALFAFLIALRLSGSLRAATLSGAIVATAMPEVYAGSHAMPAALGGMMATAIVCALLLATRARGARGVMLVLIVALVPLHHLSAFLAASMLAFAALVEARLAPADAQRDRTVDGALLGAGALALLLAAHWSWLAPQFRAVVLDPMSPVIARALPGAAVLGVAALVVLTWKLETLPRPRGGLRAIFDERRTARRFGFSVVFVGAAVALFVGVGVPGTTAAVSAAAALVYLPLAFVMASVTAGPGRLAPVRGSLIPLAASLGVLASAALGAAVAPAVLIPYRHMQYFVDAAAPLCAVALAFAARAGALQLFPGRRELQRAVTAALLAAVVVATAFTAYPTKTALVGFEEGTNLEEAAAVVWLAWDVPHTLVASDHRLSSIVFGFANHDATWEAAGPILTGDRAAAEQAVLQVRSPSGNTGVGCVLLSDDVVEGAALSQWAPATPLSPGAVAKFAGAPFVKIFDNGDAAAYWPVVGPA